MVSEEQSIDLESGCYKPMNARNINRNFIYLIKFKHYYAPFYELVISLSKTSAKVYNFQGE